jgi:hypothetical protein
VQDVLKKIAPVLRGLGFRGSGQNYRKVDGDFGCSPLNASTLDRAEQTDATLRDPSCAV